MSARSGIRFYTPDRVVEVDIAAVDAIRAELEKIAATNPPRPDVTRVLDALELHVVELAPDSPTYTPDDRERAVLLRATDHLRNFGHEGDVLELYEMLSKTGDVKPLSYRLRNMTGDPAFGITSYSLVYGVGDRLVDWRGTEYKIVGVNGGDPLEFVVDAWRPAE